MFSRKKPRALTEDDLALWQQVVKTATPMHPTAPVVRADIGVPVRADLKPQSMELPAIGARAMPQPKVSLDLAPSLAQRLTPDPLRMDKKRFGQMRKGKLEPEARLDLHGLTLDQAHGELVPFVLSAWSSGARLVLVITGKGKPRDESRWGGHAAPRHGVLRHHVPHWLTLPPLRAVVLQMTEAHVSHGGAGAIYVYLRRHDR